MKPSARIKSEIEADFPRKFKDCYSFGKEQAPQGRNNYSVNFILFDRQEKKYLLKVLLLDKIPSANRGQAQREIDICKNVISHYVVRLVDCSETDKYVFLIFPFIEGKNLEEYAISGGKISESMAREIGIGILRGIADIHRGSNGNIVHQDLKPENIIITSMGEIKLLDFGAARYKQSPYRGSSRHNYAYCSREQIRASRPGTLEELRGVLSDKADVFSTGLILYRLIHGKHPHYGLSGKLPADAILDARPIPPISRSDVSSEMKKIVEKMLEYEQLNRLNAQEAIIALELNELKVPLPEKGKFFYCGTGAMKKFVRFKNDNPQLFDGLVLEASSLPRETKEIAEIHTDIKTLIIDPQTYLFQNISVLGERATKRFIELSYYSGRELLLDTNEMIRKIVARDPKIRSFIKKIFQSQAENGADVLIAPYFYIPEFTDNFWDIDQEITKFAAEVYLELQTAKPLIKGVAISEDILQSDVSRSRIIEYLQSLYDYKGFFVLLDSSHSETIINESWLEGAKDLFAYLLATQKFVIWSRAELFGLALSIYGLNIATGEQQKQKKFNIRQPRQSHGRKAKFFYSTAMFARIKWPVGFLALRSGYEKYNQLVCSLDCCSDIDFDRLSDRQYEELEIHSIISMRNQFDTYSGRNGNKFLFHDIKEAINHYNKIKKHSNIVVSKALREIKPDSGAFLSSWANVLER
jgi:serine/threonine protein kinase